MNYLAISHPTAKWLIEKKTYLQAVGAELARLSGASSLSKTVLSVGAFRAAASRDERVLAMWNSDYLSNKGDESWGVIRLTGPYGLLTTFLPEVFERQLQIISQRIDGLLLDDRWMHKLLGGGIHSCIAGRGTEPRDYCVLYGDRDVITGTVVSRGAVCLGPERRNDGFLTAARHDYDLLPQLVRVANEMVAEAPQRPLTAASYFIGLTAPFLPASAEPQGAAAPAVPVPVLDAEQQADRIFAMEEWTYDQWTAANSPLTPTQRRILESDIADRQPLRIIGAAGSGKTLLMELLAIRMLRRAEREKRPLRVLYAVHNAAMEEKVWVRFITLGAAVFLEHGREQILEVQTLFDYSRVVLGVTDDAAVFDRDALESKDFQFHVVSDCLREVLRKRSGLVTQSALLSEVANSNELFVLFANLTVDEIALAIKGHDLVGDRKTYVGSERRLSRLHGILSRDEREFMFDVYEEYRRQVFEIAEIFDTDDLAVSLQARLTTPLWTMQRRRLGYDYVFVDETQLFNENERRLFRFLTRGNTSHVPVVLAIDEAQQTRAIPSAGLGLLGLDQLSNEALESVHRSSESILRLAFFVIQRTTDLFGSDFPDFTGTTQPIVPNSHRLARPPELRKANKDSLGVEIVRQIETLRRANIRQIGIVCHAERYWQEIQMALVEAELAFIPLDQRGEQLDTTRPLVALGRPETIGGQEFDAVLAIGLEQGVVPPHVLNQALAVALEQQALREMYVSFTRARFRLILINSHRSAPTSIISEAAERGLIVAGNGVIRRKPAVRRLRIAK